MAAQAKGGDSTTDSFISSGLSTHLVLLGPVRNGNNSRRGKASDATIECLDEKSGKEIG